VIPGAGAGLFQAPGNTLRSRRLKFYVAPQNLDPSSSGTNSARYLPDCRVALLDAATHPKGSSWFEKAAI